jgi:SAM-dependent methyltransferase
MWNKETITDFWQHSKASFAGDTTAREFYRLSRPYVKGRVLDIGAGSGALLDIIPNSYGIDITPRHNRCLEGSIDALPYLDSQFDTVFATDVLEHLTDDTLSAGLKEINRVLITGGHFILVVPFEENLSESNVYCPACGSEFHRWGHLQVFTKKRISNLLYANRMVPRLTQVLPLGLMSQHWLFRYFWPVFVKFGFCRANDLFIVAEKR